MGANSFTGGGGTVAAGGPRRAPIPIPKKKPSQSSAVSFSNLGGASSGTPTVYNRPVVAPPSAQKAADKLYQTINYPQPPPTVNPGGLMGGNTGGGGRSGGGGGGGGPSPAEIQAMADQLFAFNADPYNQMRTGIEQSYQFNPAPYENMTGQANAYNPDFAAMETQARNSINTQGAARQAGIDERLNALQARIGQVGQTYGGQMQGALRDLAGQGIDVGNYMNQAGNMGAQVAAGGANMLGLGGMMGEQATQNQANSLNMLPSIRMGGEANLANNRGQLLNQIATQRAEQELALNQQRAQALGNVGIQQATAQQGLEQARREFLLKYGIPQ